MDKEIADSSKRKMDFWDDIQDLMSCWTVGCVVDWKLAELQVSKGSDQ